jgi:hypothetical protein
MIFDGDRDQLANYLRDMADLLGLRDWKLYLSSDPPPASKERDLGPGEEVAGQCSVVHASKRATIWVSDNWAERDLSDVRETIVHELMHCHMAPIGWCVNNVYSVARSTEAGIIVSEVDDAEEVAVEGIAAAVARLLPLPVLPVVTPTKKGGK